jgi:hypothetical protein
MHYFPEGREGRREEGGKKRKRQEDISLKETGIETCRGLENL